MISCGKVGQSLTFFNPTRNRGYENTHKRRRALALPNALVREYIKMRKLDVLVLEYRHDLSRKPAPRRIRGALHEQHDFALGH